MRKRILKIMALILLSLQLTIWPCGTARGGAELIILVPLTIPLVIAAVVAYEGAVGTVVGTLINLPEIGKLGPGCVPDWRGRRIEELAAYWDSPEEIGWCPRSLGGVGSIGQDYKGDEVKVYKWDVSRFMNIRGYCRVWFAVNEKGKIIDQIMQGKCVAGTCLDYSKWYPLPPEKASAEEENKSAGGAGLPSFGRGQTPVTCEWGKHDPWSTSRYDQDPAWQEYKARFPDKDPGASEAVVKSWEGRRMDELIRAWGKPMRSYVKPKKGWRYFPEEVTTVNQWVIIDNSRPPEPKGKNYRWRAHLKCETSFGADSKGTIIRGRLFYNPHMCELMMADKLWSPRKAPGKP